MHHFGGFGQLVLLLLLAILIVAVLGGRRG
jgi:hypothetical protein